MLKMHSCYLEIEKDKLERGIKEMKVAIKEIKTQVNKKAAH